MVKRAMKDIPSHPGRVLVVDDLETDVELVKRLLVRKGYAVKAATAEWLELPDWDRSEDHDATTR